MPRPSEIYSPNEAAADDALDQRYVDASGGYNPFVLTDLLGTKASASQNRAATEQSYDLHIPPLEAIALPHHVAHEDFPSPLQLPRLESLSLHSSEWPANNLNTSISSFSTTELDDDISGPRDSLLEEDIWSIAGQLQPLSDDTKLLTWEAFTNSKPQQIEPLYISEAGNSAFDAALQLQAKNSENVIRSGVVVKSSVLLHSLSQLALGRSSTLFPSVEDSFRHAIIDQRLSGYSLESCQSLFGYVNTLGTSLVELRKFKNRINESFEPFPSLIGLSNALSTIESALEYYVGQCSSQINTALQLQAWIAPAEPVVHVAKQLIDAVSGADSEIQVLQRAFETSQNLQDNGHYSPLLFAILRRMSRPWLDRTAIYLMASSEDMNSEKTNPYSFISDDNAHLMDNIRRCASFLKAPPMDRNVLPALPLELAFTYPDLEKIQTEARGLKNQLTASLSDLQHEQIMNGVQEHSIDATAQNDAFSWDLDLTDSMFQMMSFTSQQTPPTNDDVRETAFAVLLSGTEAQSPLYPPISLVPNLSLRPLLAAQSAALTSEALRSLLVDQRLLYNLRLLEQFFLCGSGIFTARLKTVLFSPEVEAVERSKGVLRTGSRTMGLKLGTGERRDWPPASSELTLALMGVLDESWRCFDLSSNQNHAPEVPSYSSKGLDVSTENGAVALLDTGRHRKLPGNFSFAVRTTLSEEEIEKTLNPRTIFALDFLCLSFSPSKALSEVITSSCLERYDRIFKQMLRMMRMLFVVEELYRDISMAREPFSGLQPQQRSLLHSFRWRASHVITVLSSFFNTCISKNITKLHDYVSLLEAELGESDASSTKRPHVRPTTLSALAHLHDRCLAEIMTCLFQRKRHSKTAILLEEISNCILQFSAAVRDQHADQSGTHSSTEDVEQLFKSFNSTLLDFQTSIAEMCIKMELSESPASRTAAADQDGATNLASDGIDAASSLRDLLTMLNIRD